jgi:putative peptidoglycan lipid II flippase
MPSDEAASALTPPTPREQSALQITARRRLARSAGVIGVATMTSRVLGLVRDQVMAYLFGAGNAVDAFNVAFRVPNLVRDLFAEGAMSAAFVPVFTRELTRRGRGAAWHLGNNVVTALAIITGVLVVAGIIWAAPLMTVLADEYAAVPGKMELTVQLTRIVLPFLTMVAVAGAFMGMLNSLDRFFIPALSPALFNVGTIVCVVLLAPLMPRFGLEPILAMAVGALVGGIGQLAIQWPALRREGYRYTPTLDLRDPALRQVLLLMGPGTVGLAATQINVFVNTILATSEGTGAVSWLNYAFRLMYLPLGLFGLSIATAAMPAIARFAAADDVAGMRREVTNGLVMMLLLNVPATFGLIVLGRPIVALLFERGAFTAADTQATAAALTCYAIGLTGYSVVKIASPTFYALHDSRTPVLVSAGSVLVNVVLNIVLVRQVGYLGLAIGTSIASLLNATLLLFLLRRRLDGIEGRRLVSVVGRAVVASAVMALAAYVVESAVASLVAGGTLIARMARVGVPIGAALVVLALSARALRLSELDDLVRAAWRRLRGSSMRAGVS